MSLFDNIDKLINERGSAQILRECLLLADDKYAALETRNFDLQSENQTLRKEVEHLRQENMQLRKAIPVQNDRPSGFDEDTHRVLSLFFGLSDDVSVDQVTRLIRIDRSMVEYYFDLLREAGLIIQTQIGGGSSPCMYGITAKGRKYAVENRPTAGC